MADSGGGTQSIPDPDSGVSCACSPLSHNRVAPDDKVYNGCPIADVVGDRSAQMAGVVEAQKSCNSPQVPIWLRNVQPKVLRQVTFRDRPDIRKVRQQMQWVRQNLLPPARELT